MADEIHPIALALLGGGEDVPDREISCCVCGAKTMCPGFIWESVKLWNREEDKLARENNRRGELIRPSEMGITCSIECNAKERAKRTADYITDNHTTMGYLSLLHTGKYNPESLAWLRSHGHAKTVAKVLASEGTVKANVGY